MSDERKGPTHRVSFAAFQREPNENGERQLGNAREIGAIWERKDRPGEGILRFDHTPREDGVYFVRDINALREEQQEPPKQERASSRTRSRDTSRER
ncbi:MAG TPA: hypothetical protein VGE08_03950 [Steroidobacter sp.]|uniref:hypothetical protein n=1 Tax=Steroidobacter sp. TaxID=1978227 RepID=UPI002EDA079B